MDFSRNLCNALVYSDKDREIVFASFLQKFCATTFDTLPAAGFMTLLVENQRAEFWHGFTTESMGIGFMRGSDTEPQSLIDRLAPGACYRLHGFMI